MEADKRTVIDAQTEFEGTLKGKDAQIQGRFQGIIELSGRLVLSEGSRVDAQVVADAAEISGEFKGDLKVRSLVLLEKARVNGAVDSQTLSVREGAQLNGSVKSGAAPLKASPPAPSAGATPPSGGATPPKAGASGTPSVSVAKG